MALISSAEMTALSGLSGHLASAVPSLASACPVQQLIDHNALSSFLEPQSSAHGACKNEKKRDRPAWGRSRQSRLAASLTH